MSLKGYDLEHWTERFFLDLFGISPRSPILDETGKILRSFRVPSSGALSSLKGDVIVPNFLGFSLVIECKRRKEKTKKRGHQFSLKFDWLKKIQEEAKDAIPVFVFSLTGVKGKYFVFREKDFDLLFGQRSFHQVCVTVEKRVVILSKSDLERSPIKISFVFGQSCYNYMVIESNTLRSLYEERRRDYQENRGS